MEPLVCRFGLFALDLHRGTLAREGRPIAVGAKGLALLRALLQAPGQALGKSALMEAAWSGSIVEESNLTVQIAALRKLLGPQPDGSDWIVTVPRVGYRFSGSVRSSDLGAGGGEATEERSKASVERSSILVLPLANASGNKKLADGITDDVITALTRFRWFRVIGRSTSFVYKGKSVSSKQIAEELGVRYVLEGSVRRSGHQVRVSAQLVDAASASQIWAERYEMELTEAFAIQDAIAERVVGAIEPELLKTESMPAELRIAATLRLGIWFGRGRGIFTALGGRPTCMRVNSFGKHAGSTRSSQRRRSGSDA
jgi:TolB-like protein